MSYPIEIIEFTNFNIQVNHFRKLYALNDCDLRQFEIYCIHWQNSLKMLLTPIGHISLSGKTFLFFLENLFIDLKKLVMMPIYLGCLLYIFKERHRLEEGKKDFFSILFENLEVLFVFSLLNLAIACDIFYQISFAFISLITRSISTMFYNYRSKTNSWWDEASDIFQSLSFAAEEFLKSP